MKKKKEIRRFDLSKPFIPSDIKTLSEDELNLLAKDVRNNIIENCAKNGGHLASSLGVVELTIAIHHFFNWVFLFETIESGEHPVMYHPFS